MFNFKQNFQFVLFAAAFLLSGEALSTDAMSSDVTQTGSRSSLSESSLSESSLSKSSEKNLTEDNESQPASKDNSRVTLTIKPKLCVLANERQTCQDTLVISWQSNHFESLCLHASYQMNSLACWKEARRGETEVLITTREKLDFWLKNNQVIVARQSLEVLKNFAQRKKRGRKRYPWSLF